MQRESWMVAILTPSSIDHTQLERLLGTTVSRREGRHDLCLRAEHSYVCSHAGLLVSVDLFSHQWHDTSGSDEGPLSPMYMHDELHEHMLSVPGALKRAVQQYRGDDDASIAAANHSAFVLLRVPVRVDALALGSYEALVDVSLRLLENIPNSCFFNPRGEVLSGPPRLAKALSRYRSGELPPLELLANARSYEVGAGWSLADTVGLGQMDLPDQEIIYNGQSMAMEEALRFVLNLAMHLIQHQPQIESGDTAGGPRESLWEALKLGRGSVSPGRPVIRWLPEDRQGMPLGLAVP